ncbi:xanthine dehydrogenase family protein molybdopterin-binding subunit (plasmid) [Deinococcus metallilatus]|uniref:CO/xanthine dehydrogenase Mo-binding subunit n=1 Tax=Deinococcus metallilatus TaxID=1211322 RepID=A0AAJ5F660_9DEIO|nr:xanthine dehydrogenase family protein molybdopterin-binding subunit [Deinococcus metallilatus]MBB5293419.1 CO/xanthine dehydrogenase Mo-binding subunit [Deinococcus metallilatus]QBY06512.1 xanthine dehydrogenase family protein molybdopterin-binding subunit [Deinococcus metallilatus]RXJ17855.1 xanthine dehydrogenase family protein molybdopterin-binding subunit [Deinococcus metallilatus]TLK32127.1 xanthine dehydrogenase family protein molybdopterin-binding subunit [Deinococcus metallilatus]GM
MQDTTHLGKRRKIIDGLEKVTGNARYAADLTLAGMVHARPVLSPYPHARLRGIDARAALDLPGVVAVLTGHDLNPGHAPHSRSSMLLALDEVVFAGQPVAVVVATSEAGAEDAAGRLEIDYEVLESVDDAAQAMTDELHVWPQGVPRAGTGMASLHGGEAGGQGSENLSNIDERRVFERGDVRRALEGAHVVIDRRYTNARVHQSYLEPHAVVAQPGARPGEVTVYTSTQGQYTVRSEVAGTLGLRERDVHVEPMTVGGGFGAKYGILDALVAAVSLHLRRPVRLVLSRSEDMLTTMPTPETAIRVRLGADAAGRLVALDVQAVIENGVFRFGHAGIIATVIGGMYRCENVRIETLEVLTHRAPVGAYRAPGVPQALFALESSVDELARTLGQDPLDLRLLNAAQTGDPTGTGFPWPDIGLKACLERAREHPIWRSRGQRPGEGVGLALGGWPGGFSPAGAVCRVEADGTVRLHVGSVDISGVHSSMVLIAAETLGVDPDAVEIVQGTTDSGPYAPASGGSQVTISLSGAVLDASRQVRDQLLDLAASHFEAHREDVELVEGHARVKGLPGKSVTLGQLAQLGQRLPGGPGPVVAEGRAAIKAGAPGFTVQLVHVHVDPDTGQVTPLEAVSIQDVGFALNPLLVEGQMHGGTGQGLSIGLYEGLHFAGGSLVNANFLDYAFPRATDLPPIEAVIVERPSEHGPFGARIVGEPPITAGAAAVANAIRDAAGVRVTELPVTSEALWRLMQGRASHRP